MTVTPYTRQTSFTQYSTDNSTTPLRGRDVDAELDAVAGVTQDLSTNLSRIQRDDGKLRNLSVHLEALGVDTLAAIGAGTWNIRGAWVPRTGYAVSDVVAYESAAYYCISAHVASETFADDAAHWIVIANNAAGAIEGCVATFDGGSAAYVLAYSYPDASSLSLVAVDGVVMRHGIDFTVTGDVLEFTAGPTAAGEDTILVVAAGTQFTSLVAAAQDAADAARASAEQTAADVVTTTDNAASTAADVVQTSEDRAATEAARDEAQQAAAAVNDPLPRDGSLSMEGDLDLGGNAIVNAGAFIGSSVSGPGVASEAEALEGTSNDKIMTPNTVSLVVDTRLDAWESANKQSNLLTDLLDAMHEGEADRRLNAAADPLVDLSRMDPALSSGVVHDAARARIGNGGEAMAFTTLPLAVETPPAKGWLLAIGGVPGSAAYTDLVPAMTANNAPEGQVLFTGTSWNTANYQPWHAFDQVDGKRHAAGPGGPNEWIGYDFGDGSPQTVRRFTLHQTDPISSPASVHLEYSDDLASWSLAGTYETPAAVTEPQVFDTPDMGAHRAWRVRGAQGASAANWIVETVQFHGLLHTPGEPVDYASGVATAALSDDDGVTWAEIPVEDIGEDEDGRDVLFAEIQMPSLGTAIRARLSIADGTSYEIDGYIMEVS